MHVRLAAHERNSFPALVILEKWVGIASFAYSH